MNNRKARQLLKVPFAISGNFSGYRISNRKMVMYRGGIYYKTWTAAKRGANK